MLTKAIILGKEPNTNKYTVRVPLLETAASPDEFIMDSVLCCEDGVINPYNIGDVVYVGFENNEVGKPVILGKLSKEGLLGVEKVPSNASYDMNSLTVHNKVSLPKSTSIGDITYDTLKDILNKSSVLDLSDVVTISGDQTITGEKVFTQPISTGKLTVSDEGIEIYDNTTPYVDFHYQSGQVDYTLRLIETPQGTLEVRNSSNNAKITVEGNEVALEKNVLPNYTLVLGYQSSYGIQPNRFLSINYTNYTSESAAYFKMSAACCHGNGTSYQFLEDIIIGCTVDGTVTCKVFKYCQQNCGTYDGISRNYGDIFYVIDTNNKTVDFYILCGQYSFSYYTPFTKIGNTTTSGITQFTSTPTKYSSGTKVWADGNSVIMAVQDSYKTDSEQVIGTWVDGKVIYRKAFRYVGNLDRNAEVEIGSIGSALGDVIDIKQTATYTSTGGNTSSYDVYYGASGAHTIIGCRVDLVTGKVYAQACNDSWVNTVLILIVEYTKN